MNGSVINESQYNTTTGSVPTLYTLPGSSPELRIVAADDVLVGSILMSRATPAMIPSPFEPVAGNTLVHVNLSGMHSLLTNPIGGAPSTAHALHLYNLSNPAHLPNENDYEPSRIYALNGSIIGTTYSKGDFDRHGWHYGERADLVPRRHGHPQHQLQFAQHPSDRRIARRGRQRHRRGADRWFDLTCKGPVPLR